MQQTSLATIAPSCQGLRMSVIITLPESLMYEAWARDDIRSDPQDVAAYLGDLIRVNHQILEVADSVQGDVWLTTETPTALILVREISASFALGTVFDQSTTLGAARLSVKRICRLILPELEGPVDIDF